MLNVDKNLFSAFVFSAAVVVLGACTTAPSTNLDTTDSSSTTSSNTSVVGGLSGGSTSNTLVGNNSTSGITPGSVDDFTVNVPDRVFFDFDRYDLSPEALNRLNQQVEWLQRYPAVNVVIGGHADNRGTREYNLALSERRAQSVRDYIVGLGINADRVSVVAYGKERPAVVGNNDAAWAANRRAETTIVGN